MIYRYLLIGGPKDGDVLQSEALLPVITTAQGDIYDADIDFMRVGNGIVVAEDNSVRMRYRRKNNGIA